MKRILLAMGILLLAGELRGQGPAPPFSNLPPNRPVISPYLQLLNQDTPGVSNYFTRVRPQIDATNEQRRQAVQLDRLQRQVNRARPAGLPVQGSQEIRGTGHETVFLNTLHFYPQRAR